MRQPEKDTKRGFTGTSSAVFAEPLHFHPFLERKHSFCKGIQFKYVCDFGEEWRFQCEVLRGLEEDTKVPFVLREVGEAPFQYGEPDWDGDKWDKKEDDLPGILPQDVIQSLFKTLPIPMKTVENIHK